MNTSKRPNHNRSVAGTGTQEMTAAVCTPAGSAQSRLGHDVVCNNRGAYSRGASDTSNGDIQHAPNAYRPHKKHGKKRSGAKLIVS